MLSLGLNSAKVTFLKKFAMKLVISLIFIMMYGILRRQNVVFACCQGNLLFYVNAFMTTN